VLAEMLAIIRLLRFGTSRDKEGAIKRSALQPVCYEVLSHLLENSFPSSILCGGVPNQKYWGLEMTSRNNPFGIIPQLYIRPLCTFVRKVSFQLIARIENHRNNKTENHYRKSCHQELFSDSDAAQLGHSL
jgi:hypothetical protein